jgi:hypothetical protein
MTRVSIMRNVIHTANGLIFPTIYVQRYGNKDYNNTGHMMNFELYNIMINRNNPHEIMRT